MTIQIKRLLTAVILAGGKGTRMAGNKPKVLVEVEGKPMIKRVIEAVSVSPVERIIVVVGAHREEIMEVLPHHVNYAYQEQPKGTADAYRKALEQMEIDEISLVVPADLPYLDKDKLRQIIDYYLLVPDLPLVVGMRVDNPTGYGRLILTDKGVIKIVEEREASEEIKKINIINTSIYIFPTQLVRPLINKIKPRNQAQEYYLTDLIELLANKTVVRAIVFTEDFRLKGANHLSALQMLIREKNGLL